MKKSELKRIIREEIRQINESKLSKKDKEEITNAMKDVGFTPGNMSPEDIELFLDAMLPSKFTGNSDVYDYVYKINS